MEGRREGGNGWVFSIEHRAKERLAACGTGASFMTANHIGRDLQDRKTV